MQYVPIVLGLCRCERLSSGFSTDRSWSRPAGSSFYVHGGHKAWMMPNFSDSYLFYDSSIFSRDRLQSGAVCALHICSSSCIQIYPQAYRRWVINIGWEGRAGDASDMDTISLCDQLERVRVDLDIMP